jgi:hypothetical protein
MTPRTIRCFGRAMRNCRRPTYRGAGWFSVAALPTSLTACRLESSINITQLPPFRLRNRMAHSAFMPAALTIGHHFATSAFW